MKKLYNKLLIKFSFKPYKTVVLKSGLIIDHYRNGKIVADRMIDFGEYTYNG